MFYKPMLDGALETESKLLRPEVAAAKQKLDAEQRCYEKSFGPIRLGERNAVLEIIQQNPWLSFAETMKLVKGDS